MHKPSIGLSLEGMPFIFFTTVATLIFALIGCWIMAVALLVILFFVLNFFRDPERVVPQDAGAVRSPADGKVVKIETMRDPLSGEDRTTICVFMNVFNVHPHARGWPRRPHRLFRRQIFQCLLDKASSDNERNAVLIEDASGRTWTMVQIAGLIARRIICCTESGDELARGQRFGLIKFGSRVDLYLPPEYAPCVNIGEKVFAGQDNPGALEITTTRITPMDHPKPKHRGYYLLPNMMTMASLLTGFLGILWSIDGAFDMAAYAILASCVFDGLDGKLARLTNSALGLRGAA